MQVRLSWDGHLSVASCSRQALISSNFIITLLFESASRRRFGFFDPPKCMTWAQTTEESTILIVIRPHELRCLQNKLWSVYTLDVVPTHTGHRGSSAFLCARTEKVCAQHRPRVRLSKSTVRNVSFARLHSCACPNETAALPARGCWAGNQGSTVPCQASRGRWASVSRSNLSVQSQRIPLTMV